MEDSTGTHGKDPLVTPNRAAGTEFPTHLRKRIYFGADRSHSWGLDRVLLS